jgi:hypothetical protein
MPPVSRPYNVRLRWIAAALVLMLVSFALSGCPALLIPGLGYSAYQAYQYENKAAPASNSNKGQTSDQTKNNS